MSTATLRDAFAKIPHVTVAAPPARSGSKVLIGTFAAISVGVGVIGMIASLAGPVSAPVSAALMGVSHVADRAKNSVEASDELTYRAQYYTGQIYKQLELQGIKTDKSRKATVAEFEKAAAGNAALAKLYKAPLNTRDKQNRESLLTNGGIALAGALIPGGGAVAGVAQAGKVGLEVSHGAKIVAGTVKAVKTMLPAMAGGLAGGALASAISGDEVDPQVLIEAIHKTIAEAKAQGINASQVIEPNLLFLLRVSQNQKLAEAIKKTYGNNHKGFHQMDEREQARVMAAYPREANAAKSEAYAVTHDMLPIEELGASTPNLNGMASQYAGARKVSFVNRLNAERAAAPNTGLTA